MASYRGQWWYWVAMALAIAFGLYLAFFQADNPVVKFLDSFRL